MQFENLWQKDLLDLAENGFAKRFNNLKFKPTKFGGRLKVAIMGAGPAGNSDLRLPLGMWKRLTASNLGGIATRI